MTKLSVLLLASVAAAPLVAQETRQLGAHEHGVGQVTVAFEGEQVAIELHAPGADIVGFEYEATSEKDLAAIESALAVLSNPLELFEFSTAANCLLVSAHADLESEHDEHGHDDHDEHGHDDHDEHGHDDHDEHGHDDHDEHGHDDHDEHGHDDHDEHGHDDHDEKGHDDHDELASEAGHTEFHAEYLLTCDPTNISTLSFASYFDVFPNAQEIELQAVSAKDAAVFEVTGADVSVDLKDLF